MDNNERFFIGVTHNDKGKTYSFATSDNTLTIGDYVLLQNGNNLSIGNVVIAPQSMNKYQSELSLRDILRKANAHEVSQHLANLEDAKLALALCQKEVTALKLKMNLLEAEYLFDRSKVIIVYSAEERVDFRELIKLLGAQLKVRVEMRQIGSRDRAQLIGGIGICGFPLCCKTFLNTFDGISISRAKNQMLSLNIPKLSGHCGKLLCCLKFEDEYYTEAKKEFPVIGSKYVKSGVNYYVSSFNMISRTVRLSHEEGYLVVSVDDLGKDYKRLYEKN